MADLLDQILPKKVYLILSQEMLDQILTYILDKILTDILEQI